jgi:rhodanese-related sulfurtransferase
MASEEDQKVSTSNKMPTSPWLTLGMILVGITAVLSVWFLATHPRPRGISAATARAELKAGTIHSVIDVRTDEEWATGHYPHATHISLDTLIHELPRQIPDRATPILFYCRTGRRAAEAAVIAQDLGYTQLWYLVESDHTGLQPKHNILTV